MPSGNSTTTPPSREKSVKLSKAELESTDRVKIRLKLRKQQELTPPELQLAKTNYLVSPTSTVARLLSVVRKDCGLPTDTPRPLHLYAADAPQPLDLMLTAEELREAHSGGGPVDLELRSWLRRGRAALQSALARPAEGQLAVDAHGHALLAQQQALLRQELRGGVGTQYSGHMRQRGRLGARRAPPPHRPLVPPSHPPAVAPDEGGVWGW